MLVSKNYRDTVNRNVDDAAGLIGAALPRHGPSSIP